MKVLLLGVGMQGKAALHDLMNSGKVKEIVVADKELNALEKYIDARHYNHKVRCEYVDASDPESVERLMIQSPDVVIDLMPSMYCNNVVSAAVKFGVHLVNTFYTTPEINALENQARKNGVTILPEFGMDPGIDLVLMGEAVRRFDSVTDIISYGGGIPTPDAADNPLKYKVSWTLEGVLKSYLRPAQIIRNMKMIQIKGTEIFYPENVHEIEVEGFGKLEAFPNGNALKYVDLLGINPSNLQNIGRYALRYPGHSVFWKTIADMHLLDNEPITVDGYEIDRKRLLAAALEPHLQYGDTEQDAVVIRIDVVGYKGGQRKRAKYQVIDKRDLETGFTAMNRTVGYTASIGAQMIGIGNIIKTGVLSPLNDIPYQTFVNELERRGIHITSEIIVSK